MLCSSDRTPARLARFVLALLLTFAWSGGLFHTAVVLAQATGQLPRNDAIDPELDATVAMMQRLVQMADEEARKSKADVPDPAALAARLGGEPEALFAHVRDKVKTEPYVGVLRGSVGALSAGAAGPADKALLLADMLASSGVSARVVQGALSGEDCGKLVDVFLAADPLAGPLGSMLELGASAESLEEFCKRSGMPREKFESFVKGNDRDANTLFDATVKQASEEADFVAAQLASSNHAIGQAPDAWRKTLAGRLGNHAWVQYAKADGTWVDLDPSFADSEPGKIRGTGAKPVASANELPRHRVEFTLRLFTGDEAKPESIDLLNVPMDAADAGAKGIDFAIAPADELPSPSKMLAMTAVERMKMLAGIKRFQAMVRVGTESFASKVFDLDGNVSSVSADGRIEGASKIAGAVGGAFGSALGGGEPEKPASKFVRLEVVMGIERPGAAPQTSRRVLLTKADLAGDHVVSPMVQWEILVRNRFVPSAESTREMLTHQAAALRPVLAAYTSNRDVPPVDQLFGTRPPPFSLLLNQFDVFRQRGLAQFVKAGASGAAPLIDGPQVMVAEQSFCMQPENGHGCSRARIDLMSNAITVVPRSGGDGPAAATIALRQGTFETVAESSILERAVPDGKNSSAIVDLTAARKAGGFAVATSADAPGLSDLDRQISAAQDGDRLVLVPKDGSKASWWSVDPTTGTVVGRSIGGGGQSLVENKLLQRLATFVLCMVAAGIGASKDKKQWRNLLRFEACIIGLGVGVLGTFASPAAQGIMHYIMLGLSGGVLYASQQ